MEVADPSTGDSDAATGTPAPYGKACTNCARAKCRCLYRSGGVVCERVRRYPVPVPALVNCLRTLCLLSLHPRDPPEVVRLL